MIGANGLLGIIANASNIATGSNPKYTSADFLTMYPQFVNVPNFVIEAWVKIAHASLNINRYHGMWEMVMGLFVAHYLTLYLQSAADPSDQIGKIVNAGLAKGLQTSKSVDSLSVGYNFDTVAKDFDGWGTYKQTAFGQQFVTIAKIAGMGGMVVW